MGTCHSRASPVSHLQGSGFAFQAPSGSGGAADDCGTSHALHAHVGVFPTAFLPCTTPLVIRSHNPWKADYLKQTDPIENTCQVVF